MRKPDEAWVHSFGYNFCNVRKVCFGRNHEDEAFAETN